MRIPAPFLVAGVASAALYLIVFTFGLGFLFLFLPTLPLLWLALSGRTDAALHAALIATLLLAILSNPVGAVVVYMFMLGLPSWYIGQECLKRGGTQGMVIWFPLTVIFARLVAAFSIALLLITLYYLPQEGGLPGVIGPYIHKAFTALSKEMNQETSTIMEAAAPKLSFLIFSVSAWMWGVCLYLHAWLVNRELIRQKMAVRPDMVFAPFPPPNWMISLLLISALASLMGGPSLAFWGKASLITLLFPYFLLGISVVHARTKKMEYRSLILFLLYFILGMLLWPVFVVAGYGFFYHVKLLNKYLSGGGTSSKS